MPDYTGISNTCPYINDVISYLTEIQNKFLSVEDLLESGELREIKSLVDDCYTSLEHIRGMNSSLRDFGNDMYRKNETSETMQAELQSELYDCQLKLNESQEEITKLENQIEDMQATIDKLENQ